MPPDSVRSVDSDDLNADPVHSGLVVWFDPVDTVPTPVYHPNRLQITGDTRSRFPGSIRISVS